MKLISTLLIKFVKFAYINNNTNDVTNVFNDHNNFFEIINTKNKILHKIKFLITIIIFHTNNVYIL